MTDTIAPIQELPTIDRRSHRTRRFSRTSHLWPLAFLVLSTLLLWGRPVLLDFADKRLSNPGDSESFAFYLSWNVHAFTNFINPFFTPNLYAPTGLDLGNAISLPSVSILVAPVSYFFGGTAGFNAAFLLSIFFCGAAVYLLTRELFGSIIGATGAGLLATLSPYFLAHSLSHLNLMWVFGLPLIAYLVVRCVKGRLRPVWVGVITAVVLAFTAGASTELFMTESLFAVFAFGIAVIFADRELRVKLWRVLPWLAGGVVLGVILSIPVIVAAVTAGIPEAAVNPPQWYSTELTNIFVPTYLNRFAPASLQAVTATWLGNAAENSAFIPITLLVLLAIYSRFARGRLIAGVAVFGALCLIMSFGPLLTINGQNTIWMPWNIFLHVPGLNHVLPARFTAFSFMAITVLLAHAWANKVVPRVMTAVAVAISGVLLLPGFAVMSFPTLASDPPYVTTGDFKRDITPGENVLVLPPGQWGPGMRWLDDLDFEFDMPTGNGGGANRPAALDNPVGAAMFAQDQTYDFASALPGYAKQYNVGLVLVPADQTAVDVKWKDIADKAFGPGVLDGGVWVYKLQ
ncbi:hypothetical protein [Subtercola vilae]|uniref:Glycosyltransferase RgtA/B/C/D-like domain-containing protein n=1 Tax=Subtercola vilae TaxID=2056433 RepID=A0A4T2C3T2_9MICO|nr:hypothetical protein [Subtercola vilae]TIH37801.1 hypothetical protein D4765_07250 [Subtercola vilae]